jgi:hypothetical protein
MGTRNRARITQAVEVALVGPVDAVRKLARIIFRPGPMHRLVEAIAGLRRSRPMHTRMRHHAGEVLIEGFHLADEIEHDARHGGDIVLQLPMRVETAVGGRGSESHEVGKRQRCVGARRKRRIDRFAVTEIFVDEGIARKKRLVAVLVRPRGDQPVIGVAHKRETQGRAILREPVKGRNARLVR